MRDNLHGMFEATLDEKNRIVIPANLRRNLQKTDELFLALAKSPEHGNYIKIIDENTFPRHIDPLTCDSLKLAKNSYFKVKITGNRRIQFNGKGIERLFGDNKTNKLNCIGVGNHIAITTKTAEELLSEDSN